MSKVDFEKKNFERLQRMQEKKVSEIAHIQAAQLREEEKKKALKEQILKNVASQAAGKKLTTDSSKRRMSAANKDTSYLSVSSLSQQLSSPSRSSGLRSNSKPGTPFKQTENRTLTLTPHLSQIVDEKKELEMIEKKTLSFKERNEKVLRDLKERNMALKMKSVE